MSKKVRFFEFFSMTFLKVENFQKRALFFSITFFSYIENFRKFWIFNFFRKIFFSSTKKVFEKVVGLYLFIFIVSRPQSLQVASRNSLYVARERGNTTPNFGNPENPPEFLLLQIPRGETWTPL